MSPELAVLVKAYIPPWWHNEVITKEEAQFDCTNHFKHWRLRRLRAEAEAEGTVCVWYAVVR